MRGLYRAKETFMVLLLLVCLLTSSFPAHAEIGARTPGENTDHRGFTELKEAPGGTVAQAFTFVLSGSALVPEEIQPIYLAGHFGNYQPQCTPPPPNMVSWWSGVVIVLPPTSWSVAVDWGAGANYGLLLNGAGTVTGMVGEAFDFDGINDFIEVPDNDSLDFGGYFSIDAWIRTDSTTMDTAEVIVDKSSGSCGGLPGFALYLFNGQLFFG